jgi:3-oxoacyl-[acyl-carrier protein] reductase
MPEEALKKAASLVPVGRMGSVDEVAHTAAYIFENDYVSGRIIEVDGGIRV